VETRVPTTISPISGGQPLSVAQTRLASITFTGIYRQVMKALSMIAAVVSATMSSAAFAAPIVFDSRSAFTSAAGALLTDDYEDPGYAEFQDDASMNAVKGLTRYRTTFFVNFDEVIATSNGHIYAGGFTSGSFQLDFSAPPLGGSGVLAVGFDYTNNLLNPYVAFVSFGDGSSQNFELHAGAFVLNPPLPDFFGLTSSVEITGIHIGLADGGAINNNLFAMDNLSVAPVPEPNTSLLLGWGLLALATHSRRVRPTT